MDDVNLLDKKTRTINKNGHFIN